DSRYAVHSFILIPYLNPATPSERRYNAAHRRTRRAIERTFGLLKSCFQCLHKSGAHCNTVWKPPAKSWPHAQCCTTSQQQEAYQWNPQSQTPMRMTTPCHPFTQQTEPVQQWAGKDVLRLRATIS
ncbi:hypothetical protein NDU88_004734, partial [Pleurodeles waltl]